MVKFLLPLILLGFELQAQTPFLPSYYVGSGVSYDYYGKTGFAASTDFAARFQQTKFYSFTSLDLTSTTASLRTGVAYVFYNLGYWSLIGLGNAGITTGSGETLGNFSSGGYVAYDVGSKVTKGMDHFYVAVGGRLLNVTSVTVTPIFTVMFGKGF